LLGCDKKTAKASKPSPGDLIVGRIDRSLPSLSEPDLILDLRGGFVGRCCITELEEVDDWTNFPLGRKRIHSEQRHEAIEQMDTQENEEHGGGKDDKPRYVPSFSLSC